MKKNSITVGIATCYSGKSLVNTVKSIRASKTGKNVEIVITADRTPITKEIKKELTKLHTKIHWNEKEGSQFKKIKQMVEKCKSDLYISTQDDITFDKNTIKEIINAFEKDPDLTMAGVRVLPLKPVNFFENAMTSMVEIVDSISGKLRKGDNYLSSSGRCLAFKTSHFKKFRMPQEIVNGDMFLYLENKRLKGKFKRLDKSIVYIRCPQKIKDQIGPSSRYQYSFSEMKNYFRFQIKNEYKIPLTYSAESVLGEFFKNPSGTLYYLLIRLYTRLVRVPQKEVRNAVWQVDESTKQV